MRDFRKGNDLYIVWQIFAHRIEIDGDKYTEITEPYNLDGKELKVVACVSSRRVPIVITSAVGNTLKATYYGKDQQYIGEYTLTLVENDGKEGMATVDECRAFRLVSRSCDIRDNDCRCDCDDDNINISPIVNLSTIMDIGVSSNIGNIDIDSELSTTSENPVQNKVVTNAINDIKETALRAQKVADQASKDVEELSDKVEDIETGHFTWVEAQ